MKSLFSQLQKRLHTSRRLTALVWLVSLLLLASSGFSAWHLRQLQTRSEAILSMNVTSIRSAVELEIQIQELRHRLDRFLWLYSAGKSRVDILRELDSIKLHQPRIRKHIAQLEASAYTAEEKQLIQRLKLGIDEFDRCYEQLAARDLSYEQRASLAGQSELILEASVLSPAREYLLINEELLDSSQQAAEQQTNRLVHLLLFFGIIGTIVALTAGYSLASRIHRSLVQLRIPMQDVAGKLNEVAGEVVFSTSLDLTDLQPALARVSEEVSSIVEQLHSRHQEILHAEQLSTVGQLAAGIAHEIRNPLMSMKIIVQAALSDNQTLTDRRDLEIMDEEIRRLETLLNEFLEFARPSPLHKSLVDLGELSEATLSFLHRQALARNVTLRMQSPSQPVIAYVDASRVRQVILNLILNALDASPPGGQVEVCLEIPDVGGGFCRLFVRDEGHGISPEDESRIFEPFFSTKETGLGLGLAVSRRIIESHGGKLSVNSRVSGCEFVIQLPLASFAQSNVSLLSGSEIQTR